MVAAIGKPKNANAFGGFAKCYVNTVLRKGPGYQRIDVLLDGRHSIKATTRSRRSENTARPVSRVIEVRKRGSVAADEVASIFGTRRQQSGLCTDSLRWTYLAGTDSAIVVYLVVFHTKWILLRSWPRCSLFEIQPRGSRYEVCSLCSQS